MRVFSLIFRKLHNQLISLKSNIRKVKLKLLYPNIVIDKNSFIGNNCYISCSNDSKLIIKATSIQKDSVIVAGHGGHLEITDSFIGGSSWIVARKKITIKNSLIGEMVSIRDNNHNYNNKNELISNQGFNLGSVFINSNAWIGCKVTILPNTIIGENTVVAANAVAKGNLKKNSVYGGIPVKKLKDY